MLKYFQIISYRKQVIFFIIILGIIIYSNSLDCSFNFDDSNSIVRNTAIKNIDNIKEIWKFWPTRFLTYLSFAFNYHFHNLNVFGYHVINLFIHLTASIMVWWFIFLTLSTKVMKNSLLSKNAHLIAFFCGVLFLVHPVQIESVTYITQRATSLGGLFYISAMAFYVKARLLRINDIQPAISIQFYVLSLFSAIFAMFSKEMVITLPLMLLLYELLFFIKRKYIALIPFFGVASLLPLTMIMTKSISFTNMTRTSESSAMIQPIHYLLTQFRVIITYIRILFFPVNKNLDYNYPLIKTCLQLNAVLSLTAIIFILFFAFKFKIKYKMLSFGIFWFFISLLPESSIIPIKDVIFEHRLYIPSIGFIIFFVCGIFYIMSEKHKKLLLSSLVLIISILSIMTYMRNNIWKTPFSLWNDVIKKSPNKSRPYLSRGLFYYMKGDLDLAIADYTRAIKLKPDYAQVYINRSISYRSKGLLDKALADINKSIYYKPDLAEAYNTRANLFFLKGEMDQAISDYNKALKINPAYGEAYFNRALVYFHKDEIEKYQADLNKAESFGIKIKHNLEK